MTVILLFHVSYSDYICHIRLICRNAKEEKKEFDNNNHYYYTLFNSILFLAFASLLKDRLSDRFSSQLNYIPSMALKRKIRCNEGCYIDNKGPKFTNISRRMSNCNNTINNYSSSCSSSASIPCPEQGYDAEDPYIEGIS